MGKLYTMSPKLPPIIVVIVIMNSGETYYSRCTAKYVLLIHIFWSKARYHCIVDGIRTMYATAMEAIKQVVVTTCLACPFCLRAVVLRSKSAINNNLTR